MWQVLALFGTPLISLGNQSLVYALSTPSCQAQTTAWLHAVNALSVLVSLVLTAGAWLTRPRPDALPPRSGNAAAPHGVATAPYDHHARQRQQLVGAIAPAVGAFFTVVTAAQWIGIWVLSPCHN